MPEVKDLDERMLRQSLKNIDGLMDGEEDGDIIAILKAAKIALEAVRERKGWQP